MSTGIKAADIITVGGSTLIHRLQTAGPGDLSINKEKVGELGNYESLAILTDTPELSMSMDSFDVTCATEYLLTGGKRADRAVAGVDTTAASDVVDVPASSITSRDIGSGLLIPGAGLAGDDLFEVIAVLSATSVQVNKPAVNTVAGAASTVKQIKVNLDQFRPINIAGYFKGGKKSADPFDAVSSAAMPYLNLESFKYSFGVTDKATQNATLKGDSIYYVEGSTWEQSVAGSGVAGQEIVLGHGALPYHGDPQNDVKYALDVNLLSGKRLVLGSDYTEDATGAGDAKSVTLTLTAAVAADDAVRVVYQSDAQAEYPQLSHEVVSAIAPAAIKGKNVRVKIGGYDITDLLSGVQNATVNWQVTLERGEEMGNTNVIYIDQTDVPQVTGDLTLKPRDPREFLAVLRRLAGISNAKEVIGADSTVALPIGIELYSPEKVDGKVVCLKTLSSPDAKFTIPGYQGQMGQNTTIQLSWESESGVLFVYEGVKP